MTIVSRSSPLPSALCPLPSALRLLGSSANVRLEMSLSGYSGTPLVKKLGIKSGTTLALVGAPPGFRKELVGLAADVHVLSGTGQMSDLTVWFVTAAAELKTRIAVVAERMGAGALAFLRPLFLVHQRVGAGEQIFHRDLIVGQAVEESHAERELVGQLAADVDFVEGVLEPRPQRRDARLR
jgi:hypothetical protein